MTGPPVESRLLTETILLRIPASTPHIRVIRQAASALGALLDFTYDRIQDLHIAIDEVCSRIIATSDPPTARIEVTFEVESGDLRITARGDAPVKAGGQFLTKWSQAILRSVTDGLEIVDTDGAARVTFHLGRGVVS